MRWHRWIVLSWALVALLVAESWAGKAELDPGPGPLLGGVARLDCAGAPVVTCGEGRRNATDGPGNVTTYGCTGLEYDGAQEFVYELCVGGDGAVAIEMTYEHQTGINDLDLFLLGSCDESDCIDSSLGTGGTEAIAAQLTVGTYYIVVDGWGGRQDGTPHNILFECSAPCATSVSTTTWGEIKALHRGP